MASAAPKTLELPAKMAALYNCLEGKGDVDILEIYTTVINPRSVPQREAQQYLGPYITKLNRRLREHYKRVTPGRMKGTYTLVDL